MTVSRLMISFCFCLCLALRPALAAEFESLYEAHTFRDAAGNTLPYRLLTPAADVPVPAGGYPLVLFLHGAGERGSDNVAPLVHGMKEFARDDVRRQYPCFVLVPQCPDGKRWVEVDWGQDAHQQLPEDSDTIKQVLELTASLQRTYRIDTDRVYATGLSMGGFGVWDLITRHPEMFAAAVPICGGGDEQVAAKAARIPVWAFHGDQDTVVKPARSRNMIAALRRAGGTPIYTEYAGVGHDSWNRAFAEPQLLPWFFAQRRDGRSVRSQPMIDLTRAVVVTSAGERRPAEAIAPTVLIEEVARRTGVTWQTTTQIPDQATAIITLSALSHPPEWKDHVQSAAVTVPPGPESYAVQVLPAADGFPAQVHVIGRDPRGVLFGVGKLLRQLSWGRGRVAIETGWHHAATPDRPLRGHQIGYRDTANSWDAWTFEQYDQYFRELAIFGTNAVENIPWQEDKPCPLMKYSREEMNLKFAELCEKYDLDHWIWVPVLVTLPNDAEELAALRKQEEFYRQVKRLDAIFVPGGDPGDNKANVLLPHLEQMAALATKYHPSAKIWLSLQRFNADDVEFLYDYLEKRQPTWFGGLVMGPSSPPMELTRRRLPKAYALRWYPDITHCVRCQYPIPWLDPAWGLTLGREPVNPRPVDYTQIYQMDYSFTSGFLTYSDGINDDFNKCLWSQLGWDPTTNPRDVARDYARFYFGSDVADLGADALFALEANLRGPLAENATTDGTLALWQELERRVPAEPQQWRFRMHLFRAYYDAYTRARFLYENDLEQQCLKVLADAKTNGVPQTLAKAREILARTTAEPVNPQQLQRLYQFGDELFQSIGLQTSVPKYHASNYERGAVLDFVEYPLNNRWWLENQFDRIAAMSDPEQQLQRLETIRNWENPGQGGYYDVVGHVGRSPRIIKLQNAGDAMRHEDDLPMPTQRWMYEKKNNLRQAWHIYMDSLPNGVTYNGLDPSASYTVKLFSQRFSPLMIDGTRAKLIHIGETYGRVTEQQFEVPASALEDGRIKLTWDHINESNLNWRDRHYVTDIWILKQPKP